MRAQQAGFRCVVVDSTYVYHAEHQTVRKMPEREALFGRNRQWCERKWGRWLRLACPRFQPIAPGSPELRQWLERLVEWARRRTHVYVYAPLPSGHTKEAVFRSVGLVPHADVLWRVMPERPLLRLTAMGNILARQKKRFYAIVAPDPSWAAAMRSLRWVHRAPVLSVDDERFEQLWQSRSL